MSLTTITIGTASYISYASVAEADTYLAVDPVRGQAWAALDTTQKGRLLVAATRRLDQFSWLGSKTGGEALQPNAFPRKGLVYADGTAVPDNEVPLAVEQACCLLAGTIAANPAASQAGSSASNTRRVKAGSAEVEFFRPVEGVPLQDETAWVLIKAFVTGSGALSGIGGAAYGGSASSSAFGDDQGGFGLTEGYP